MHWLLAALILLSVGSRIILQKNAKDMIQHSKSFKGQGMNGIEIEYNVLTLLTKDCVKDMRQGLVDEAIASSKMLMKQCLNTIAYLQKKYSPCHVSLNYLIFTIYQRSKKMVNYCLL